MNKNRLIVAGLIAIVAAVAVGVSQRGDSSLKKAANKATVRAAKSGGSAQSGSSKQAGLPEFSGKLFGGGTLNSSDIKGPAVIHVYASWCPTCQGEAPAFAQLQRKHPELNYYFVAVDDSEDATMAFAKQYGWKSAPTVDDSGRKVESAFGLSGQPHTIFVSRKGAAVTHQGPGSFGDLNMLAEQIS